jgi:glyoxylase-like metal-dependent hydrolase (beta-lactamase superfamily II)
MPENIIEIGNVEITAVVDAAVPRAPRHACFPALPDEAFAPFAEFMADDGVSIPITITSFLVRSEGKTILVDTGIGAKGRAYFPNGRLPEALGEIGVGVDDIDIVLATHIHVDHVGWHTTAVGDGFAPTFPKATYVFNRPEWEFFTSPEESAPEDRLYVRDSILPLRETGADIQLVDGEYALTDDLTLLQTPGHTPAHVSVAIASQGEAGVIIGDVCHHPAQVTNTDWSPIFDMNPVLSARSREALMQKIEAERMTMLAGHFAAPGFGRVVLMEGQRYWRGLDD